MAINHFDIATEGVRRDHQWIATLGFWQIEITAERVPQYGYRPDQIQWKPYEGPIGENYIITIKVKYKNRIWKIERLVSEPLFNRLKVIAKLLYIQKIGIIVSAAFKKILNTIKVLANRKD